MNKTVAVTPTRLTAKTEEPHHPVVVATNAVMNNGAPDVQPTEAPVAARTAPEAVTALVVLHTALTALRMAPNAPAMETPRKAPAEAGAHNEVLQTVGETMAVQSQDVPPQLIPDVATVPSGIGKVKERTGQTTVAMTLAPTRVLIETVTPLVVVTLVLRMARVLVTLVQLMAPAVVTRARFMAIAMRVRHTGTVNLAPATVKTAARVVRDRQIHATPVSGLGQQIKQSAAETVAIPLRHEATGPTGLSALMGTDQLVLGTKESRIGKNAQGAHVPSTGKAPDRVTVPRSPKKFSFLTSTKKHADHYAR